MTNITAVVSRFIKMSNKTMDEFYKELKKDAVPYFVKDYLNLCKRYNLYIDREYYGYEGDYYYTVTPLENHVLEILEKDLKEVSKDEKT